jgi:enolase-phosphatase E1
MSDDRDFRAVLLDIEGTTTSISFVYDVLFPYARMNMQTFLEAQWSTPDVRADVALLRKQAIEDHEAGENPPMISNGDDCDPSQAVASALWQMEHDRKTTGLKSLQGKIWKAGYQSGELKGHLYPEVADAITRWVAEGIPVYIYSSGSVAAQQLLFGHSMAGDLRPSLSGYFDTTTGPKKQASSYSTIAEKIACNPTHLLFLTDSLAEAEAAREAGVQVMLSSRPGNPAVPEHDFPVITSFEDIG